MNDIGLKVEELGCDTCVQNLLVLAEINRVEVIDDNIGYNENVNYT